MREEYKNILDKMVINKDVINECTDGRKLLMYLQMHKVLSYQETEELYQMGPTKSIQSRNDAALTDFLNSLKEANYDDAYSWLKGKLNNPDSALLCKSGQTDITLKTACNNLKIHYNERLEFVESYWRQFGVKGILNMDTFYNFNIVISNEKYKQIQKKIENFDDLFSTDYKRIIVMAEAGYGKSTFVHEIARQWVKGVENWTRKFEFLFLFRLTEVKENESKSLEDLLSLCLYPHDASKVYNWLLKDGNMSKALFIFDGLDELSQDFCQEVHGIIFGGKVNLETVVITSRQCDKLEGIKKDKHRKLYIELKGYTNEGTIRQLKKFSVPVAEMKKDLKDHLNIPLFNTIFCITHSESSLCCTSICSSIHSFVHFALTRYRNTNQSFTKPCREELLLILGQAAQNKFSFIQNVEIPYLNVSSVHLFWAINSGLLHNSSLIEDLVFAHQTIAEYCAAYFWCKTNRLAIKWCSWGTAYLNEPPNAKIQFQEPFSQFVCYLCPEFKEDLWQKFDWYVPIFDEYENLPDRLFTDECLQFSSHSVDDQITIMNKLHFQDNSELRLFFGCFKAQKLFKTIQKLKTLDLSNCTFNIGAEAFFTRFINVQYLILWRCKFYNLNIVHDDSDPDESNPPCLPHLSLQKLAIRECSEIETFLSFIMKHSVFMKSFELRTHSHYTLTEKELSYPGENSRNISIENDVEDCGIGWISELQSNKRLCISIENCVLHFEYPSTLNPFIETIKIMRNIKRLNLTVGHKLTKLQASALADLLEIGLLGLKDIDLYIKMENKEDYEPILKNLSKLSALTSLSLWNRPFTTDTLKYLIDIFNKLKLKECTLQYQEIFFEERIINSINSCISLKKIATYRYKKKDNSNYKLFEKGIENKDKKLIIQDTSQYSEYSD